MMMMVMMVMMMMMMICLCFFAAVGFAGFALVFCFSSGAALGVEGVWPLLTHVILAAALESFWLKRFGSSFLAQEPKRFRFLSRSDTERRQGCASWA